MNMYLVSILTSILLLSGISYAQETVDPITGHNPPVLMSTSPSSEVGAIKQQIRASMILQQEVVKMKLEVMSDPQTAGLLAKFSRVYYEALIKEGFSKKEAMTLVQAVGIPSID